jgi:mRNA-degrading endonuclease toxin of MazEF toxin-antitoxin module
VSTDNITVVRKALLTRHITTLGPERVSEVCRALELVQDNAERRLFERRLGELPA